MSAHVLQCVWPIVDETFTRRELIDQATEQLDQLADRACAIITGPPLWYITDAAHTPGWHAYAPGSLLVAVMPAESYGSVTDQTATTNGSVPDPVAVERLISNDPPARIRSADRRTAVLTLDRRGVRDSDIAARLGMTVTAVEQTLHRHRRNAVAA